MGSRDLVEVRPIEGIGYGVFAKTYIPRGTILLEEDPIFAYKHAPAEDTELYNFCDAYHKLTSEAKSELHKLHCDPQRLKYREEQYELFEDWCRRQYGRAGRNDWNVLNPQMSAVVDELIKACGTSDTNCASAGSDWNAVYRQFSRYNHSCAPTCSWNISVRRRRMQMTTTADIRPDEELYVSYDWTATSESNPMSLKERRRRLKQWGFTCACTRCMEEEKGIKLPLPPARGSEDELYSESSSSSSSWSGTRYYPQEVGSEDEPANPYFAPQYTYTEIPETYPTFQSALRSKFPTAEEIMETLNAFQKAPHHMPNPSFLWQENSESSNPEIVGRQLMMNHNLTKEVADLSEPEWHMSAPTRSLFR